MTEVAAAATENVSLRRVAALALPALAALSAEPLYLLVDTAVVGHLGRIPLAALAVGGIVLTVAAWIGGVIAYGTTGRAARQFGAGARSAAVNEGAQASWLALAVGLVIVLVGETLADPIAGTLAGRPEVAHAAGTWLRIAALGAPGLLLATAGSGWMRGVQDTRRPMVYVLGANLLSAVLCPVLVFGLGLGLAGSAIANVAAQTVSGGLFVLALVREAGLPRPRLSMIGRQLRLGRDLVIRGLAFQACFLSATAVAARFGPASVAAHQIALQLWLFCSLALDSVAIAAQALVGAALGAGHADQARHLARRVALIGLFCGIGFGLAILAGTGALPRLFSADAQVQQQARVAWPWFVAMQPLAGVVFALDGVLIGAGDVAYMRNLTIVAALGGFLPMIWLAYALRLGLGGVWAGLALFIVIRLVLLLRRLASDRWAVVGAVR